MLTESGMIITAVQEVAPAQAGAQTLLPGRRGFDTDVPWGGANKYNPGGDYPDGRQDFMSSLYQAYVGCPWLAAPIDAIARTVTAGGLSVEPTADVEGLDEAPDKPEDEPGFDAALDPTPPGAVQALQDLLDYCNPSMDIIQLLRGIATDLGIYGDAFTEVVWLLGRPVALYPLDPASMTVDADEHGVITGYTQVIDSREAHFEPREVIHISMDAPKGSLYGMGIAQKALLPVTIWLFVAATIKETMRKGDPPHLHLDFPLEVQQDDVRAWRAKYAVQNLGTANIGAPITTRGGAKLTELQLGKLEQYLAIQDKCRDTILSVAGVPPAQVSVIESGNLGGGTGASQFKTFKVNTCGPIAAIILEKLNYHLTRQGFGIDGWEITLQEVDWRDDATIEEIRDKRIKNGLWSLNEARADIDMPSVGPEGDAHILALSRVVIDWADMADYSTQTIAGLKAKAAADQAKAEPPEPAEPAPEAEPGEGEEKPAPGKPAEGEEEEPEDAPGKAGQEAERIWRDRVLEVYRRRILTGADPRD